MVRKNADDFSSLGLYCSGCSMALSKNEFTELNTFKLLSAVFSDKEVMHSARLRWRNLVQSKS